MRFLNEHFCELSACFGREIFAHVEFRTTTAFNILDNEQRIESANYNKRFGRFSEIVINLMYNVSSLFNLVSLTVGVEIDRKRLSGIFLTVESL